MAEVDDRVQVVSRKLDGLVRDGVVTGVSGSLLRIRWSTGEESTVVPAAGSLRVIGKDTLAVPQKPAKSAITEKVRKK